MPFWTSTKFTLCGSKTFPVRSMNDTTSQAQGSIRPKWLVIVLAMVSFYFGCMASNIMLFGVAGVIRERYDIDDSNIWALLLASLFLIVAAIVGATFLRWQRRFLETRSVIISYVALIVFVALCVLCTPLPTLDTYVVE